MKWGNRVNAVTLCDFFTARPFTNANSGADTAYNTYSLPRINNYRHALGF
jgi:hypothetical protein